MPREGLEPTLPHGKRILSPPRLPFRHLGKTERRRADSNRCMGVLQTPALTSWLHRRNHQIYWSGRRDSNPRPLPWQGSILPLNYFRSELILPPFWGSSKSHLVPRGRFERPRAFAHHPLKMACLPIPPPRLGRGGRIRTHDLRFWRPLL